MTPTQQTKIAEMLVNKLKAAHNQPYEEILPPSVKANQIRQQMVMAGVVYELMREAWISGNLVGYKEGVNSKPQSADNSKQDFEHFLNNITKTN